MFNLTGRSPSIDAIVKPLNDIAAQLIAAVSTYEAVAKAKEIEAANAKLEEQAALRDSQRASAIAGKIQNLLGV